jgi:hypothetical protein
LGVFTLFKIDGFFGWFVGSYVKSQVAPSGGWTLSRRVYPTLRLRILV